MAYLVIELNVPGLQIGDFNTRCVDPNDKQDACNGAANLIMAIASGNVMGGIKLVSKDVATTIATSGTGSESTTYVP